MKSLIEIVSELRRRQGRGTQKALAQRIGISPAFLSDIYSGKRRPGKKVLGWLGYDTIRAYRRRR